MNILREIRKISKKSKKKKIMLIMLLSIVLIVNTYACFFSEKETNLKSIEGKVNSWDISYVISEKEILDEEISLDIDTIYPGMPIYEKDLHIYNLGNTNAQITIDIISVQLFGNEIANELKEKLEITDKNNEVTVFADLPNTSEYPFKCKMAYDKLKLEDKYGYITFDEDGNFVDGKDENNKYGYETNNKSVATIKMQFMWDGTNDVLDTQFGKKAFEYYQNQENTQEAMKIKIRVTSSRVS